jgi:alpha-galactosidase
MAEEWAPPSGKDFDAIHARQAEHYQLIHDEIDGKSDIEFSRTHEYCSQIIHAIETNTPHVINGNVVNTGLITNLPQGCVVEVPCLVDGLGIHPCYVGELPPQCAALNRTNINVQELAVKGALEQDVDAIYRAVQLDPLTASKLTLEQARQMTDELLAASQKYVDL